MKPPNVKTHAIRKLVGELKLQAELRGDKKFEVPFPCSRGHFVRYTSNVKCSACQSETNLERYHKKKSVGYKLVRNPNGAKGYVLRP